MSTAAVRAMVPATVREVCSVLTAAGHQAVTVGGAVRDALIGRTPGDWDVATSAHPDQVIALFPRTIPTGLQHGTVTVLVGRGDARLPVEVTTFRGEGAYSDARRPDHVVFGVPLHEDLARRDLVVNAIAYDPERDELIDPFGGRDDLANRVLRAVGDPVARFTEDGLRVMRAIRFAAVLGFALDPDTEAAIPVALPSLARVSRERVHDELEKLLAAPAPSVGLVIAIRTGVLAQVLPEVSAGLRGWPANAPGRLGARVDAAVPGVRLAALLAEVGPSHVASWASDQAAAKTADLALRRLKFSNDERGLAVRLVSVANLGRSTDADDPIQLRRAFARIGRAAAEHAVLLWRARAAELPAFAALADQAQVILAERHPLSTGDLAVTGADLMTELGLPPGKQIGQILADLLDAVLVDPAVNQRDALLARARTIS